MADYKKDFRLKEFCCDSYKQNNYIKNILRTIWCLWVVEACLD